MNSFRLTILVLNLIYITKFSLGETPCTEFNPCKNLAECLMRDDDPSRVRCVCKRGFNGNLCEKYYGLLTHSQGPRTCSQDFCFNGGTCVMLKRIPRCLCQSEFRGLFCENLTFPSKTSEKINPIETIQQNTSSDLYLNINHIEYTTPTSIPLKPDLPPIEFFTSPQTPPTPIENMNPSFLSNPFFIDQSESKNVDINPFINYETIQTSPYLASTTQDPTVSFPFSTSSFMTFEYPKEEFFIGPEHQQQNIKNTENNNILPEAIAQVPSICSFDPCLNYGNCIPITNSNSLFKFRCVCPENFTDTERLNFTFTEPLKIDTTSTSSSTITTPTTTTTTTTTTTPVTLTSTFPIAFTTTTIIESSSASHRDFGFIRNQKKYSICTQLRPCANNGQCVDVENFNEGMQRFRCICKSEFTGIFCHIKLNRKKVNACTYNSCLNSGECIPSVNNSFSCVCPPAFTGKFCELNSY